MALQIPDYCVFSLSAKTGHFKGNLLIPALPVTIMKSSKEKVFKPGDICMNDGRHTQIRIFLAYIDSDDAGRSRCKVLYLPSGRKVLPRVSETCEQDLEYTENYYEIL